MNENIPDTPVSEEGAGLPREEFSSLLESIGTVAPLLKGFLAPSGGGKGKEGAPSPPHGRGCAQREALLCAMKPYLSPARCEALE